MGRPKGPDLIKRSYYMTKKFANLLSDFCLGKNLSDACIGAFAVWMTLPADVREDIIRIAKEKIPKKSVEQVARVMAEWAEDSTLKRFVKDLPKTEKRKLLNKARK